MTLLPAPKSRSFSSACHHAVISNWKTTAIGLLISFTGFVAFSPDHFGGNESLLVTLSRYIAAGGFAALGIASKDYNMNGKGKSE
jgi:hypothetical protein